jgi:ankyrin repeat protein
LEAQAAFFEAVVNGDLDSVRAALAAHPSLARARDGQGITGLHHAKGCRVKELLLEGGAEVDARANDGSTPLFWAVAANDEDSLKLLLAKGADVKCRDNEGNTALHQTAVGSYTALAELLLAFGANVNARNDKGFTPLHYAVLKKDPFIVPLLMRHRADIHADIDGGDTPLDLAKRLPAGISGMMLEFLAGVPKPTASAGTGKRWWQFWRKPSK